MSEDNKKRQLIDRVPATLPKYKAIKIVIIAFIGIVALSILCNVALRSCVASLGVA